MRYDRTIIAYHGCDAIVAERILAGVPFERSENSYDWLGSGVYFWEFGLDRAWRFAEFQRQFGKVTTPAVVGTIIQLGECFDLMDTRHTMDLADAYASFRSLKRSARESLPKNRGKTPERKLRHRDCAVLNFYLRALEERGLFVDTVRCAFLEGHAPSLGVGS